MGRIQGARRVTRRALVLATTLVVAVAAAGCNNDDRDGENAAPIPQTVDLPRLSGQELQVTAVWTGTEQDNFVKVLKEFEKRTGAKVSFVPSGDDMSTFVGSKVAGGQPPDIAMLQQVGVLREFADKKWIKPMSEAGQAELRKNFSRGWQDLGSYEGTPYGVYFKASNKSLIWYNTRAFDYAGAKEPTTWKGLIEQARLVSDSGVEPVSVGGADGWTLTDWFENIYLSQAGPKMYDKLSEHQIKWTDPSVTQALTTLAELFGDQDLLTGGNEGALRTEFPQSVTKTFAGGEPSAAMVFEADFVAANVADAGAELGKDAKVFPFPAVGAKPPVVTGGDVAVALKNSKAAQALLTFLASPDAAAIWAREGGLISANTKLDLGTYPNAELRDIAKALVDAGDDFRFDMSDQAPASFGGKPAQGEWKALQDFLKNPKDISGIQRQLEKDAAKAFTD
ncbi:ABC transporter substrate-binding protein [Streptomyces zagrosensis]|uniref:Alpha-glucoside transport system substrate-binding protein n=1 Tax=Streptomyces zagrosensis TaxID=1042984 RepID=A0A7W9Q7Z9_9ACTN|nr:extracellular solute-binding protein [Streptomyces zagrosensis]MBB5935284.1 alpha-glucoside transport system substrate-binding protein [Streptomyces zagrosensis]